MKLITSLQEIYAFKPCEDGWMRALEPRIGLDWKTTFPLIDCCDTNTFSDVCWLLQKRKVEISIAVRAARLCADSVAHLRGSRTAAAYAADAYAAAAADAYAYDAADAAYDAADAAYDATYAAYAAYAADAAYVAADMAAADMAAARKTQQAKNMNFLRQAILEFEANLETSHGQTPAH